jgi:hypothetical protein
MAVARLWPGSRTASRQQATPAGAWHGVDAYLHDGLAIDEATVAELRHNLALLLHPWVDK